MKYVIMCSGYYDIWEDTPRQLLCVSDNETLIERTINLLFEHGVSKNDILITAMPESTKLFEKYGVSVIPFDSGFNAGVSGWWVDGFYDIGEETCYIFGDVFFSMEAIHRIVLAATNDLGIRFFASSLAGKSLYFPKQWNEPFAFKVWNTKRFRNAIEATKDLALRGGFRRHPISWELWHVISGRDPLIAYDNYDAIDDYTCDIDSPTDLPTLRNAYNDYMKDHFGSALMPGA